MLLEYVANTIKSETFNYDLILMKFRVNSYGGLVTYNEDVWKEGDHEFNIHVKSGHKEIVPMSLITSSEIASTSLKEKATPYQIFIDSIKKRNLVLPKVSKDALEINKDVGLEIANEIYEWTNSIQEKIIGISRYKKVSKKTDDDQKIKNMMSVVNKFGDYVIMTKRVGHNNKRVYRVYLVDQSTKKVITNSDSLI